MATLAIADGLLEVKTAELGSALEATDVDRDDSPSTTLEVLNGDQQAAAVLAARLRLPQTSIKMLSGSSANADLRVIVGQSQQPYVRMSVMRVSPGNPRRQIAR